MCAYGTYLSLYHTISISIIKLRISSNTGGYKCMAMHGNTFWKTCQVSNISNRGCEDGVIFTFTCYETRHLDLSCRQTCGTALNIDAELALNNQTEGWFSKTNPWEDLYNRIYHPRFFLHISHLFLLFLVVFICKVNARPPDHRQIWGTPSAKQQTAHPRVQLPRPGRPNRLKCSDWSNLIISPVWWSTMLGNWSCRTSCDDGSTHNLPTDVDCA